MPFSAYTDPVVIEEESTSIFSREWVFVCMAGEVSQPGDYFAMIVANEPVFVLRGEDGELRAFANICRHRGTVILDDGFGQVGKYITCPYHAWSYSREGAKAVNEDRRRIGIYEPHFPKNGYAWLLLMFIQVNAFGHAFCAQHGRT